MSILRDFEVDYNLENGTVASNAIYFFETDKNISVLKVKLLAENENKILAYLKNQEVANHSLELKIRKTNVGDVSSITATLIHGQSDDVAVFLFEIPEIVTSAHGEYECVLIDTFTEDLIEKKATSDLFNYYIKQNKLSASSSGGSGNTGGGTSTSGGNMIVTVWNSETGVERDITLSSSSLADEGGLS